MMGERREIAGGADRPLAGNDRDKARFRGSAARCSMVDQRTPEAPCARLASFSAMTRRTTATGSGSPTPAACESTILRWSVGEIGAVDAHARELSEAGVDAVDRLALGDDRGDGPARRPRPPARQAAIEACGAPR